MEKEAGNDVLTASVIPLFSAGGVAMQEEVAVPLKVFVSTGDAGERYIQDIRIISAETTYPHAVGISLLTKGRDGHARSLLSSPCASHGLAEGAIVVAPGDSVTPEGALFTTSYPMVRACLWPGDASAADGTPVDRWGTYDAGTDTYRVPSRTPVWALLKLRLEKRLEEMYTKADREEGTNPKRDNKDAATGMGMTIHDNGDYEVKNDDFAAAKTKLIWMRDRAPRLCDFVAATDVVLRVVPPVYISDRRGTARAHAFPDPSTDPMLVSTLMGGHALTDRASDVWKRALETQCSKHMFRVSFTLSFTLVAPSK